MIRYISVIILLTGILTSCNKKEKCIPSPDISDIKINLNIERIDEKLFAAETREEVGIIVRNHPVFAEFFLFRSEYPDDSILVNQLYELLRNREIQVLWEETQDRFGSLEELKEQFSESFRRIKYYYPEYRVPEIKFVFTGLSHDMFVSDSLVIVGLDFYLGEGASYRPLNIPDYILKRYRKENIVPNTMLLLSDKFNKTDKSDQSLLADMIYYGKAHYFAKQMLPCVPDSIFLGYSPVEMTGINKSEGIIWANFIENELLFETDYFLKDKFISERPKTFEIGDQCPGRIGRWVGWEIVKEYMKKNPEITFNQLMNEEKARQIFDKSRYKPRG